MDTLLQITAVCVVSALLIVLLKRLQPENALLMTLAVSLAAFVLLGSCLEEVLEFLDALAESAGVSGELLVPLYKVMGIALVVRIGGSLCRDAGESALSTVIETAGAVCALLAALPLFQTVWELLVELMK
jgi:stage III sporulation protein AD